jgi:hypothetical protein
MNSSRPHTAAARAPGTSLSVISPGSALPGSRSSSPTRGTHPPSPPRASPESASVRQPSPRPDRARDPPAPRQPAGRHCHRPPHRARHHADSARIRHHDGRRRSHDRPRRTHPALAPQPASQAGHDPGRACLTSVPAVLSRPPPVTSVCPHRSRRRLITAIPRPPLLHSPQNPAIRFHNRRCRRGPPRTQSMRPRSAASSGSSDCHRNCGTGKIHALYRPQRRRLRHRRLHH